MAKTQRLALAVLAAGLGAWVATARAQERLSDFSGPILVLNTGGHHAPIRSLVFTPDGGQLLSGGLDKVVHVWGLQTAKPTLDATIRPPIWRGPRGAIQAVALSPTADGQGQRVLAVAGFGVANRNGNIGLFHFPGSSAIKTGDHFAELINDDPIDPLPSGHTDTVTSLAFQPEGRLLASASNDGTARIWDWTNRKSTAILRAHDGPINALALTIARITANTPLSGGHVGPINALAFTPDGARVVTGGRDGTLRLWDLSRPAAPIASANYLPFNAAYPLGVQINALAVSSDGRWVVIGREDGRLIRYDAADLGNPEVLALGGDTVEALALSHDGAWLVTSSIKSLVGGPGGLPRLDCTLKVRRFPGGADPRDILVLDDIAFACSFSPDDKVLAVGGGDRQAIALITNWNNAAPTTRFAQGQGRSITDVGLTRDEAGRLAVGFSHDPDQNLLVAPRVPPVPRVIAPYRGMILPDRRLATFDLAADPAALSRGLLQYEGWTVTQVDQFHLEVKLANQPARTFTVALDEVMDRRWKCYSFIPPGPQHPKATLAVGCSSGVWFYGLDDGGRRRLYAGHDGAVTCLAPSKDGHWLATGSFDQTVRLWTLAGCDEVPRLGAVFEPDGRRAVKSVEPLSFGEAMGLQVGDKPVKFALGTGEVSAAQFFARYESQAPNLPIELIVEREVGLPPGQVQAAAPPKIVPLYSSKRNSPAVSLFVGEDREWVLWMPRGYYDTSIAGDTKFLGWHLNQVKAILPARPTDYLEIIKFEKQFRQPRRIQPNKLDTLLEWANLALALDIPFPPLPPVAPVPAPAAGPRLVAQPPAPQPIVPPAPRPPIQQQVALAAVPGAVQPPAAPVNRPAAAGAALPPPVAVAPEAVAPPAAALPPANPVPPGPRMADANAMRKGARPAPPAVGMPPAARPPLPVLALAQPPAAMPRAAAPVNRPEAVVAAMPPPPLPPQPLPAVAEAPEALRVGVNQPPAPVGPRVQLQPVRPQPAVVGNIPLRAPPLGPVAVAIPAAPARAAQPQPPAAARQALAVELQPPPLEPADYVEQSQPPSIEPMVQPLANQQITTLEGKPIDLRQPPPDKIQITELDAQGKGTLVLDMTIASATGRSPARAVGYRVDGQPVQAKKNLDPLLAVQHDAVKLSLAPGPHRFTAEVENDQGIRRSISRDIFVKELPRPRTTRLKVLTIAPAYQEPRIPPILFAERDVADLRTFFARYLVSPENGEPFSIDEERLEGAAATADKVKKAIDQLKDELSYGGGDLFVVVIESHFLIVDSQRRLVAADSASLSPSPAIAADDLAKNLGTLARRGCKVLVLLDAVHTVPKGWDSDVSDWVRHLRDDQNVITFVASNSGPSQTLRDQGHRAFAQAVLESVKPPTVKDGNYLLNDFRDVVIERVLQLTERQQQAACYLPETLNGQFPILNPQSTGR